MRSAEVITVWYFTLYRSLISSTEDEEFDQYSYLNETETAAMLNTINEITSSHAQKTGCCGLEFNPGYSTHFSDEESISSLEAEILHFVNSLSPLKAVKMAFGADALLKLLRKKVFAERLTNDLEKRFVEAVLASAKADLRNSAATVQVAEEAASEPTSNKVSIRLDLLPEDEEFLQNLKMSALNADKMISKTAKAQAMNLRKTALSIRESAKIQYFSSTIKAMLAYIGLAIHDILKDELSCVYPLFPTFLPEAENVLHNGFKKYDLIPHSAVLETKLYFEESSA